MLSGMLSDFFKAKRKSPDPVTALVSSAASCLAQGDLDNALALADQGLSSDPTSAPALQLKASIFVARRQFQSAVDVFRNAPEMRGRGSDFWIAYGKALQLAGDNEMAELKFRQAVALGSDSMAAETALGLFLLESKRYAEASECFGVVLSVLPTSRDGSAWLGQAYFCLHDYHLAAQHLARAHAAVPLDPIGVYLLSAALINLGRTDEAEATLMVELQSTPDEPLLIWLLSLKHLWCGNWSEGLRLHERRYDVVRAYPAMFKGARAEPFEEWLRDVPRWMGGAVKGKRLLIWCDQGLGDAVMNLRFLSVLKDQYGVAELTVLGKTAIEDLVHCSCAGVHFMANLSSAKAAQDEFDLHCSMFSLPFLLDARIEGVPGTVPYIRIPDARKLPWQRRLDALPGLKIGLAWSGNAQMSLDELRSIAVERLAALFSCAGVSVVCLQKDDESREALCALNLSAVDWMDQCPTLVDTAALIDCLDLVISVDTVVAHLAGAVGKPVWLLNRYESEWRWLRGRTDSVWYPSMRIFNQTESKNWAPIIQQLLIALDSWVAARSSSGGGVNDQMAIR